MSSVAVEGLADPAQRAALQVKAIVGSGDPAPLLAEVADYLALRAPEVLARNGNLTFNGSAH